ncbi:M20/M25/M40 family metallo-hydrolase [Alterisphingorhabdus coralli]|uniref:M20/M25/M40 family metallo-hydrolase n=1 Tax=Alterisphingorhabdus coralli TaxID=3071408 RepID=A0AA97I1J4_9SPHN|nr:M20/M25/M40 family metallo-hydrolase [Parasphingorhabdus sp. SCSIO 66989]WOE76097.1 M20/M25/M40 family metallo-hydrolase [Parasphingorhabdus sp. SCSIO 66989]
MLRVLVLIISALALYVPPAIAQDNARARSALAQDYDAIVADIITITEIPAPPFGEERRAAHFADAFRSQGLKQVTTDPVGNVIGVYPDRDGEMDGPFLVVSAHLDTVFPEETDVTVKRDGDRLLAPGIGDDSLGLAALLAWHRAMVAGNVQIDRPILFVGTVGEEGLGDLRGVRYLMTKGAYAGRIAGFISVDGSHPERLVHAAVGSKRYEIVFNGPGGHSYGAFGIVNPMAAMAEAVRQLYAIDLPADPRATYSASVVSGGRSVNTIPDRIALQVDMRSEDSEALDSLESRFLTIVDNAVANENEARSTSAGQISAEKNRIGDRPAGTTPVEHPLVQSAGTILTEAGYTVMLAASSTDSNIAMSMGIPAITIGTGGGGGRAHALDEYLNVERSSFMTGLDAGLQIVIAAAGVAL